MAQIWYRLADGKIVPVEVNEKVAQLFREFERYERRLALQKRRHESKFGLEYLMEEKGFDRADPSAEIETAINRRDLEAEQLQFLEEERQILSTLKQYYLDELKKVLPERQAIAYFYYRYLKWKKVEIAAKLNVTEGAVRKLIGKAEANLEKAGIKQIRLTKELNAKRRQLIFGRRYYCLETD